MGPILSSLVDLQELENRVRKTRKELKKGQQQIRHQEQSVGQLDAALKARHEEIKLTRMQYDKLELDLKQREERISHMRVALNSAKTNKEYSTALTRINTDKADTTKLEDQILALMANIDSDLAACKQIEEDITEGKQRLENVSDAIAQGRTEVEAQLEEGTRKRDATLVKVPTKYGSLFERLADRYDGEVLAEVSQMNGQRSHYTCGGCYMKVPLEVVNSLMTRDDVIICPNCGRILILDVKSK